MRAGAPPHAAALAEDRRRAARASEGASAAQRAGRELRPTEGGRASGSRVRQAKGLLRRAHMQEGQVRAHQARAQQQRGFRCSASSESIPQPASVGELGTRAHGLLAAGLARAARRWKRSLRSANGNAIVVTVLRSPLALNEGAPGWAFSHPRGRLLGRLATHKPLPPATCAVWSSIAGPLRLRRSGSRPCSSAPRPVSSPNLRTMFAELLPR